jgi:sodium/potassium-transporting ATPase subunit alpha
MSLAMAAEKAESSIMSRPPYNREKDHLLNLKLLIHAYLLVGNFECVAAFMFTYENFGINPRTPYTTDQLALMNNVAQSVYYCSMCLFQFFNYFATRTRYTSLLQHNPIYGKGQNLYVFLAILISAGIQLLFTQIFWFNKTLGTGPVPIKYIVPTFAFGTLWLFIDELRKFYVRKRPRSIIARISW